jgi:hypothetical protein
MQWSTLWFPDLETAKLWVSAVALVVGLIGGLLAYASYRRNEKWKSAEFLAQQMKSFLMMTKSS